MREADDDEQKRDPAPRDTGRRDEIFQSFGDFVGVIEGHIPLGTYGPGVVKTRDKTVLDRIKDPKAGIILCGTNRTRTSLNAALRARMGYSGIPKRGERVVALRNDREAGVYNGMLGEVFAMEDDGCPMEGRHDERGRPLCRKNCQRHFDGEVIFPDGDTSWSGPIVKEQFGAEKTLDEYAVTKAGQVIGGQFDYGYAITTHKAQGAEWDNVIVVEECGWMSDSDARRWRYTAITRARTKLVFIQQ